MQKSIIIQSCAHNTVRDLDDTELNKYLSEGWNVVHLTPVGCAVSGDSNNTIHQSAVLIIIEKNK